MTPAEAMASVTQRFADESRLDPYHINNGYCDEWADDVMALLPNRKVEIWETIWEYADTTHVFLRIDGIFYDAEAPQGVKDHMELPIFANLLIVEDCGRQGVWRINANHDTQDESTRDVTSQELRAIGA